MLLCNEFMRTLGSSEPAERSGILEKITVPAGEFLVCRVENTIRNQLQVTQWLGQEVQFGIVREKVVKTNSTAKARIIELSKFGRE